MNARFSPHLQAQPAFHIYKLAIPLGELPAWVTIKSVQSYNLSCCDTESVES